VIILTRLAGIQKKLIEKACKAMNNAYVLWGFQVGAAVLAEDGRIYEGCNIESWVSGLGTCAERNAINHAVLHGNRKIKGIAVVINSKSPNEPRPCGACLQYIRDFAENTSIEITMVKARSERILLETIQTKKLAELLPFPYEPSQA
jgi:cytidine deaminase